MSQNLPSSEARTRLDAMLNAWDLSRDERDLIWKRVLATSHSPDDPAAIVEALGTILDRRSHSIIQAIEQAPQKMNSAAKEAAREVMGPVTEAATQRVAEAHANLTRTVSERVAAEAVKHFNTAAASRKLQVSANVVGVAFLLAVAVGWAGWSLGRANLTGYATEWTAILSRPDSSQWLALMRANPDLASSMAKYCGPGGDYAVQLRGARGCHLPLWIDSAPPPPTESAIQGIYYSALDWLAGWRPLWLLGGGLLAGLLGRKLLRKVFHRGPLAWLID